MNKTFQSALVAFAALSLTACGNSSDEKAPAPKASAGKPALPEVKVDRNFLADAGRWTTAAGSVSDKSRLIIDLASDGSFTIDVRATNAEGKEAIVESSSGKAVKNGDIIHGMTEQGPGAHAILKKFANWQINATKGAGKILSEDGKSLDVRKESF